MNNLNTNDSYFDGGLLEYIGIQIVGILLILVTLGLGVPWVYCMGARWRIDHTVIDGRRLHFDGTGGQLFGQYIKWWFLSLITLGIYSWWIVIKLQDWEAHHTHLT